MEETNYHEIPSKIKDLIEKYILEIKNLILRSELRLLVENVNFMTTTTMVPHDFFDTGKIERCSDKVLMKDFNNPTILFTDLKGSTDILRKCEQSRRTCLYTGYIYYSSCLLADILDFVNGKIVEITGDGTYSIIEEINDNKVDRVLEAFYKGFKFEIELYELYTYIHLIGELPFGLFYYNNFRRCKEVSKKDVNIRNFIFCIFTMFNIEINKFLEANNIDIAFFTRVGCKKGPCKITRFEISDHVKVDKLIGSTVNNAAHQAMGKH